MSETTDRLEATLKRLRGDRTYLADWIETNVPGAVVEVTAERWRVERKQPTLEYRVVTDFPRRPDSRVAKHTSDEGIAREWAVAAKQDYPYAEVWIERRAVGDWRRLDV